MRFCNQCDHSILGYEMLLHNQLVPPAGRDCPEQDWFGFSRYI